MMVSTVSPLVQFAAHATVAVPEKLVPTSADAPAAASLDAPAEPQDGPAAAPGEKHRPLPTRVGGKLLDMVSATGDFIDDHPVLKTTVNHTLALCKVIKAFPKFIYPSIQGATAAEKTFILQTLDSLPLKDVNTVKSLVVVPTIPNASGLAIPAQVTNVIKLARDQISIRPEWFREVVIHEVGHTKDFDSAWFGVVGHNSAKAPWNAAPFVSDYAKTNHWEDYAETHARYHMQPDQLKAQAPGKFNVMEAQEKQGVLDRLIDQKAFRETGKFIGEHLGGEVTRTAVQAVYWASSGIQVLVGLDNMRKATEQRDPAKHVEGVLGVAAGTLFASKVLALGGLGVQGASRALREGIAREQITAEDADLAVRMATDPIEHAVRTVGSHLGLTKSFNESIIPPTSEHPHRLVAGGIAVGGGVGAVAGGIAGPYLGIMAGYSLAGPIGGVAGLVLGGLAGYAGGASLGGRVGGAIGQAVEKALA